MKLEQITSDSLLQEKAKVNFNDLYREVIRKIETLVSHPSSNTSILESSKARFEQSLSFKDLTCSCIRESAFFDITEKNEVYPGIKGSFNDITVTCASQRPGGTEVVLSIMGISGEPFIPKIQVEKAVERISVEVLNGDYRELPIQSIVKRITNANGSNLKVERLLFGPKLFTKDRELEVQHVTFSKIVAKKIEFRSGAIINNMDTPTVTEGFECWLDAKSKADLTKLNIQNGNNKTTSTIVIGETILRSQWDMLERVFEKRITGIRLQVSSTRMPFGVGVKLS